MRLENGAFTLIYTAKPIGRWFEKLEEFMSQHNSVATVSHSSIPTISS